MSRFKRLFRKTAEKLREFRKRIMDVNDFRLRVIHGVLRQTNRRTMDWHTHAVKIVGLDARMVE